jgi:cobalamin biosynthesis protein CobD/CbiB
MCSSAFRARRSTFNRCSASIRRWSGRLRAWGAGLFAAVLCAAGLFLWFAHQLAPTEKALAALAIVGLLWVIGRITQTGPHVRAAGAHG